MIGWKQPVDGQDYDGKNGNDGEKTAHVISY
jgi:hypothetical protein